MKIPMEEIMDEIKDTQTINPQENTLMNKNANTGKDTDPFHKVSLVELIMILMLAGLVLVFVFGMQQMKIDKRKEAEAHEKFEAIIPTFAQIIKGMEEYKKNDEFADYPIDMSEIGEFSDANFTFGYDPDARIISATSKESFGKQGVIVSYSLENSVYEVLDDKPGEKPTVKDDWLP